MNLNVLALVCFHRRVADCLAIDSIHPKFIAGCLFEGGKKHGALALSRRGGVPMETKTSRMEVRKEIRFTVDILSGTSAGGINAVYLAKALANCQTIDQLKQLWVEEGDLLKLINDAKSVEQLDGLKAQKPPRSLLNSQRMYRRLLEALDGMEEANPSKK